MTFHAARSVDLNIVRDPAVEVYAIPYLSHKPADAPPS